MSEKETTAPEKESSNVISLTELNKKVDALFDKVSHLVPSAGSREVKEDASDVSSQIERALQDAKSKDEATAKEAATESRIKKLEELTEKRPHSYSRLTRFMWGGED